MRFEPHRAFRTFVLVLATGCALFFYSQTRASAQTTQTGAGYIASLLEDPAWCWVEYRWSYKGRYTLLADPSHPSAKVIAEFATEYGTVTFNGSSSSEPVVVTRGKNTSGERLVRVPCPPAPGYGAHGFGGLNGGLSLRDTTALLTWAEALASTGQVTSQNSTHKDPLGEGIEIGYGFSPWAGVNNLVVDPFLSLDYQNWSVDYMFPGGSYIGAKSNYEGTAGVKIGPAYEFVWVYAIAGVSFLNETLTVNFVPVSSSITKTVPGFTAGLGGAIQPNWLQFFGVPTALSLEAEHTWWQTVNFDTPASSPLFNYAYKREDDTIKLGVHFYFDAGSPPSSASSPPILTKASVSK
jgi:hypothetical protein